MQYMEDIYQKLRSSGLRSTKQRIQISKILFKSNETFHFTILDLEKMIKKEFQEKISVATIYNTVHAFQKKGYLKEIPIDGNKKYYDTNMNDHHHFFDEDSQTLKDLNKSEIRISKIPNSPINKKIKSVEVLIRLANDNQNQR